MFHKEENKLYCTQVSILKVVKKDSFIIITSFIQTALFKFQFTLSTINYSSSKYKFYSFYIFQYLYIGLFTKIVIFKILVDLEYCFIRVTTHTNLFILVQVWVATFYVLLLDVLTYLVLVEKIVCIIWHSRTLSVLYYIFALYYVF